MSSAATTPDAGPLPDDAAHALFASTVLLVTGKGGVGKTTGAAALALAGAARGYDTLLVDVEGRDSLSGLFGTTPWSYDERELRRGLWGVALDPTEAVYEYLELFYGLKRVRWLMERSSALDFVTTAAPGLRDLLLLGKVYEIEARDADAGRRGYDLIVVDAPPTGRIVPFLQAPEAVTEIVRAGPIRRQAGQIQRMLLDAGRARAVLVTLLEEMPVRETLDSVAALRAAGIALGPLVANAVVPARLSTADLGELETMGSDRLRAHAADAGAALSGRTAAVAVELARGHRERLTLQHRLRQELDASVAVPVHELPVLAGDRMGLDEVAMLGEMLLDPAARAAAAQR